MGLIRKGCNHICVQPDYQHGVIQYRVLMIHCIRRQEQLMISYPIIQA